MASRKKDRRGAWLLLAALLGLGWWLSRKPAPAPAPVPAPVVAATPTPVPAAPGARLALVIDDWGYREAAIERIPSLPGPLTLAVIPRLAHSRAAAEAGAAAGFEVILHCPMQAQGKGHPEPGMLRVGMDPIEVRASIEQDFISVPGAVGLNNHEGSLATQDRALMDDVAGVLKDRQAYFLDSLTTPKSCIPAAAKAAGIPWASRRVFLDNVDKPEAIRAQLMKAAELAKRPQGCIAIGHPRRNTLDVIQAQWPVLQAAGIRLVKVSALLERP